MSAFYEKIFAVRNCFCVVVSFNFLLSENFVDKIDNKKEKRLYFFLFRSTSL